MTNVGQICLDILIPFTNDYNSKLTASEISRIIKTPRRTVSRHLNKLVSLNLIGYEKSGKNKLFYFDIKKQTTNMILNLIENYKALKFQLKSKKIAVIINEILNYCESLIVFGSYASGEYNKSSDLDVVILGRHNEERINKIKEKQTMEINEHYISYNKFLEVLKSRNALSLEIMKNHVLFGNVSKVVDIFLESKI